MLRKLDHNKGICMSKAVKMYLLIAATGLFIIAFAPIVSAHLPGRMTGGGSIQCGTVGSVTHGFELHCIFPEGADPTVPNSLEINWGGGQNFHLTSLTTAVCTNQPGFEESPPEAGFDTMLATGTGTLNQVSGYTIEFRLVDDGEPGAGADLARYLIRNPSGEVVLNCPSTTLEQGGNHQAHKVND
jgi:hypothetical protein